MGNQRSDSSGGSADNSFEVAKVRGQYKAALSAAAEQLSGNCAGSVHYSRAVKTLVSALQASEMPLWTADQRSKFIKLLISETTPPGTTPKLHNEIAGLTALDLKEPLIGLAEELKPTLISMLKSGEITKNCVLLLLQLREFYDWVSPIDLSRMHIDWLDKFEVADLGLPYRTIFDTHYYRRNNDDVINYFSHRPTNIERIKRFKLSQLIFFEWLTRRDLVDDLPIDQLSARIRNALQNGERWPCELAAARSLIARNDDGLQILDSGVFRGDKHAIKFSALVTKLNKRRLEIRRITSGVRPNRFSEWISSNRAYQLALMLKSRARPFIGPIRIKRNLPKVAVCISGQLRGYKSAYSSWAKLFLPSIESRIFVHSWERIGRSGGEYFRHTLPFAGENFSREYRRLGHILGQDELMRRYPKLFQLLAGSQTATPEGILNYYGADKVVLEDDTASRFANWSNSQKMHYKIEACYDLARESGEEFDLILRIRPDKAVKMIGFDWASLKAACCSRPVIFADYAAGVQYATPCIGDQVAVGAPFSMKVYCNAWTDYPALAECALMKCTQEFSGHASLSQICWLNRISVEKLSWAGGTLEDPEPLSVHDIIAGLETSIQGRNDVVDQILLAAALKDGKNDEKQ